jgi:hypothetical protein
MMEGATGGKMVGDLLLQNTQLTALKFTNGRVSVEFIRALRHGLLASFARLNSLGFRYFVIPEDALHALRLIYEHIGRKDIALTEFELDVNEIRGPVSGDDLRRLLLMLPDLKTLVVGGNFWGPGPDLSILLAPVMDRLHSLELYKCNIGIAQLTISLPGDCVSLLQLDLTGNYIEGGTGGEALANVLRRCERLQDLCLSDNGFLGPDGARALSPRGATFAFCKPGICPFVMFKMAHRLSSIVFPPQVRVSSWTFQATTCHHLLMLP